MKMYFFMRGFQRRVWCPKCTPASSNSFIVSSANPYLLRGSFLRSVPATRRLPETIDASDPRRPGLSVCDGRPLGSALAELEALARSRLSVLFAFLHARVARQQTLAAQQRPKRLVFPRQGPGDRHAQRPRLARETTTVDPRHHVVLVTGIRDGERVQGVPHQRFALQVLGQRAPVDQVLARAGHQLDPRD